MLSQSQLAAVLKNRRQYAAEIAADSATPAGPCVIRVNGRAHTYATQAAAESVAGEIFARTGIVVGIEAAA